MTLIRNRVSAFIEHDDWLKILVQYVLANKNGDVVFSANHVQDQIQ